MTASFLNETVDQELQLSDLSAVHGAWLLPVAATGLAFAAGWVGKEVWDLTKEDIADAIHDFISDDITSKESFEGIQLRVDMGRWEVDHYARLLQRL